MRELTLSGGLNTEGGGQTLKGDGRWQSRIEKHIVGCKTQYSEGKWQNAQIRLLRDRLTDLLKSFRELKNAINKAFVGLGSCDNVQTERSIFKYANWFEYANWSV